MNTEHSCLQLSGVTYPTAPANYGNYGHGTLCIEQCRISSYHKFKTISFILY